MIGPEGSCTISVSCQSGFDVGVRSMSMKIIDPLTFLGSGVDRLLRFGVLFMVRVCGPCTVVSFIKPCTRWRSKCT